MGLPLVRLRFPYREVERHEWVLGPVHETGRQPVVLGDGERLPFAPRQVLDVRDQMVAEHFQNFAFKFVSLGEGLQQQVVVAPDGGFERIVVRNEPRLAAEVLASRPAVRCERC